MLVGTAVFVAVRPRGAVLAYVLATVISSLLFGLYHFAHSPPFDEPAMAAFLIGIGLLTSGWWYFSRDLYGTAIFHNFFALTGVIKALKSGGLIPANPEPSVPLIATAIVFTVVLVGMSLWVRKAPHTGSLLDARMARH
jgi:membrane protease YdiL (CAAX protease family)